MAKETSKLAGGLKAASASVDTVVAEEEVAAVIKDVMEVTGIVSVAVFEGIGVSLGSRSSSRNYNGNYYRRPWMGKARKKENEINGIMEFKEVMMIMSKINLIKGDEEVKKLRIEKMKELEKWIGSIECDTEKLFRSLINTRVSILNALSH